MEEKEKIEEKQQEKPKTNKKPEVKPSEQAKTPLSELFSDPALLKVFKKANIKTVEQLKQLSDDELLKIPGIRATRLGNIRVALGKPRYPVQKDGK